MSLITPSMLREYATSLIIDPESRTIQIPKDFLLGVYNDKDVKYVPFVIPRFYEENDFGDFSIQVNYIDADKNTDAYLVTDPIVEDHVVRFNWILGRGVFLSHGTISFIVCFRIADQQGNITKEFNTTIHSATVLEGLEVEETIDPEAYSILANIQGLEASASAARNQAVQQATLAAAHEQAIEQMLVDTPRFASSISDMTDTSQLYIYSGNEAGFQLGAWYYYNTDHAAWELYGNLNTDTTLSVSGMSADGKATGDALALKANISDVNVALTAKADASDVEDALALKADADDVTSALAGKVDTVTGKQLSTEDFTSELKTKLEGVAAGATNVTVDSSMSSTSTNPVQNKVINTALGTKLATTGDSKDLTTTFTSSDVADGSASAWTSVGALANTEKHSSIFAKVSQMFKNVRYLFKMLGTTDISSIGNGTVSGALSTLNTSTTDLANRYIFSSSTDDLITKMAALPLLNRAFNIQTYSSLTSAITNGASSAACNGIVSRNTDTSIRIVIYEPNVGDVNGFYSAVLNTSTKEWSSLIKSSNDSLIVKNYISTGTPVDYVRTLAAGNSRSGCFLVAGTGTDRGTPDDAAGWVINYFKPYGTNSIFLIAYKSNGDVQKDVWIRTLTDSSDGQWFSRSNALNTDISSRLNSNIKIEYYSAPANGLATIPIVKGTRGLILSSSVGASKAIYAYGRNSAGAGNTQALVPSGALSFTDTVDSIVFTSEAAAVTSFFLIGTF